MIKIEKENEMLNTITNAVDNCFMDTLNAKLDQILDPDIIHPDNAGELARQIEEGNHIIEEESGITASDVVIVTLNGTTTYF